MTRSSILALLTTLLFLGCTSAAAPNASQTPAGTHDPASSQGGSGSPAPSLPDGAGSNVRYVALGDSYTIGTGLRFPSDRWPNQLRRALRPEFDLGVPENLAENSASTIEVIESQLPRLAQLDPDLVSLQIGINDVIPRADAERYRRNLDVIFDAILARVPAGRVVVITIPDWTLTPDGGIYVDPPGDGAAIARLRAEINRFNALLRAAATARGIAVVDIAPVSNLVTRNPALLLDDESHPSPLQYAGWVELIAPVVRRLLRGESAVPPTPAPTVVLG